MKAAGFMGIHRPLGECGTITVRRKLHDDLCDQGEICSPNRVARLARLAGIMAQIGYKRRPGKYGGNPNCAILDHRSIEEYSGSRVGLPGKPDVGAERSGRIPGALHIPFDSLLNDDTTFKTIDQMAAIIGSKVPEKSTQIISYCRLAHRATLASFVMTELLGYKRVRVYDGSWTEWGSIVGAPIER